MGRTSIGQGRKSNVNVKDFPSIEPFLHRPILYNPPLCTLKELQDGTYSIQDLIIFNELLDYKDSLNKSK